MAPVKCKDCGKEFSTDVKRCPNCKAKRPRSSFLLWALLFFIFFPLIMSIATNPGGHVSSPSTPPSDLDTARVMCEEFTKKMLHDPDSAEFDNYRTYPATVSNGIYHVQVRLRAKNGFNAMRRTIIDCKAMPSGRDKWMPLELKEIH